MTSIDEKSTLRTFLLAAALFLLSGALGLGYQLIWIRKATLIVGSSQLAYATTVASFFLGLALGSGVVGRYLRSRRRSPLFVYGIFEAIIGVYALSFPWLFAFAGIAYNALYPAFQNWVPALILLRFILLLLLFVVPTFFMGGTLPLLLDGLVARDSSIGAYTSLLYGINIVGAVGGVLATSYFAIPLLGMNATSQLAGLGNLAIAAVALLAFREVSPIHVEHERKRSGGAGLYAVVSFLSGFAAIAYQIEWVRYLDLVTLSDVYRTAMILAVYLSALAAGSLALSMILRRGIHPLRVVALTQPLVPVALLACLGLWSIATITYPPDAASGTFQADPSWFVVSERFDATFLAPLAQVSFVLFVPVLLIGTGLPALIVAATRQSAELRRTSGILLFWNTLGSSAGGFLAAYTLIPVLGLQGTIVATGLISVAIGIWADREHKSQTTRKSRKLVGVLRYALPAISLATLATFARGDLVRETIWETWAGRTPQDRLVEIVEGPLNTSFVIDGPSARILGSNNVLMGMAYDWPTTQAVQGHLSALFYGRPGSPERVLGIALGTGQSFGALLMYPIQQLDVVDISPELVDLSLRHFADFNHGLVSDERVNFYLDDGRHFVDRAAPDYYDIVTLEPPPPIMDAVYPLYTREFFEGVERVLRDGGIFTQWLPFHILTPSEAHGIVKTQFEVFPHTFVMTVGQGDFFVLSVKGSSPPRYQLDWIRDRVDVFERERLIGAFRVPGARHPLASVEGVLSMIVTGPDDVAALPGEPYEDDRMGVAYPRADAKLRRRYGRNVGPLTLASLPRTPFERLQRYFADSIPAAEIDRERAWFISSWSSVAPPSEIAAWKTRYEEDTNVGNRVYAAIQVAQAYDHSHNKTEALAWMTKAVELDPNTHITAVLEQTREIARHAIDVFDTTLQDWLESLPEIQRSGTIAHEVAHELERHDEWESEHRAPIWK